MRHSALAGKNRVRNQWGGTHLATLHDHAMAEQAIDDDRSLDSLDSLDPELEELARRYGHRVRFFADRIHRRFGLDACWRDDLVSAGWWGLFKALRNRRPDALDEELSAYVSQRIEGAVLDEARACLTRRTRRGDFLEVWDHEDTRASSGVEDALPTPPDPPERAADRARRWRLVARALQPLGAAERRILMAFAQGSSFTEIARVEGIAPGTLHQRVQRATRTLRAKAPHLRAILGGGGEE